MIGAFLIWNSSATARAQVPPPSICLRQIILSCPSSSDGSKCWLDQKSTNVKEVAMAHERLHFEPSARLHGNKTNVGPVVLISFVGLLLLYCLNEYYGIEMFGRQDLSLGLLTGLLSLSRSAFGRKCQTETLTSSPPSNSSVALQSYSYCGGTLKVGVSWIDLYGPDSFH